MKINLPVFLFFCKKIMKMSKLSALIFLVLLLMANAAFAATTLVTGDIAFVGLNSDGDDEFSFLLLKDKTRIQEFRGHNT